MNRLMMLRCAKAQLMVMDMNLDKLKAVDPYGNILQSFETKEGERITTGLIRRISKDIKAKEKNERNS